MKDKKSQAPFPGLIHFQGSTWMCTINCTGLHLSQASRGLPQGKGMNIPLPQGGLGRPKHPCGMQQMSCCHSCIQRWIHWQLLAWIQNGGPIRGKDNSFVFLQGKGSLLKRKEFQFYYFCFLKNKVFVFDLQIVFLSIQSHWSCAFVRAMEACNMQNLHNMERGREGERCTGPSY